MGHQVFAKTLPYGKIISITECTYFFVDSVLFSEEN
jgi:hypothetical protein